MICTDSLREHKLLLDDKYNKLSQKINELESRLDKLRREKNARSQKPMSGKAPRKVTVRELLIAQLSNATPKENPENNQGENSLSQIIKQGDEIAKVKKQNVYSNDITQDEQKIIDQRVEQQKKQFQIFEEKDRKQKAHSLQKIHPHITHDEAIQAIQLCDSDEVSVK